MKKFKVGDTVRILHSDYTANSGLTVGSTHKTESLTARLSRWRNCDA